LRCTVSDWFQLPIRCEWLRRSRRRGAA
jgi:hypothetical protein